MFETAPPELLQQLRQEFNLDFLPVPIVSLEDLLQALAASGNNLGLWVDDLWEEYQDYDSILAFDNGGNAHRFLRTITSLVARDRVLKDSSSGRFSSKETVREYLKESIEWPDGRVTERLYNNTLSEKWRWRVGTRWIIHPRNWRKVVRRAVLEELGVLLTKQFTRSPWLQRFTSNVWYFKDPETGTKGTVDVRLEDKKRPNVITHNHLHHTFLKLHPKFWKTAYREEKRRAGVLVKTMVHTWTPAEVPSRLPAQSIEQGND